MPERSGAPPPATRTPANTASTPGSPRHSGAATWIKPWIWNPSPRRAAMLRLLLVKLMENPDENLKEILADPQGPHPDGQGSTSWSRMMTIACCRRGGPNVEQFNAYLGPLPTATHCFRNNRPPATDCLRNNPYGTATDCFGNNLHASATKMELFPNQSIPRRGDPCGRPPPFALSLSRCHPIAKRTRPNLSVRPELVEGPAEQVGARILAKFALRPVAEGHGASRACRRPVARRIVDQVEVHVLRRAGRRDPVADLRRA